MKVRAPETEELTEMQMLGNSFKDFRLKELLSVSHMNPLVLNKINDISDL